MSLQRLSLRNRNVDSLVRNPVPTQSVATGEPSPTRQPQLGWSRFRDMFAGGNKPRQTTSPTSPQAEPNGQPQKKNVGDFLSRIGKLFGERLTRGLERFVKMAMSMSSTKPILPPPNTFG